MSFKRLSIVTVFLLVALILAGQVLAAVVASITIQDQQVDLSDPNASVNITLSGDAQTSIPIVITYDDGSTRYLAYTFNYVPPPAPSSACSNDIDCSDGNSCTNDSCVDGQCSYSNKAEGEVCLRDPSTYEPAMICDDAGSCSVPVSSGGGGERSSSGNTCEVTESFNCTGENAGCGSDSGGMKKTVRNADCSETAVTYCDPACASGGE